MTCTLLASCPQKRLPLCEHLPELQKTQLKHHLFQEAPSDTPVLGLIWVPQCPCASLYHTLKSYWSFLSSVLSHDRHRIQNLQQYPGIQEKAG